MVSCMGFYFGIIHLRLDTEESSNQKNQPTNKQKKLAVSSQMTGKVATKQDRMVEILPRSRIKKKE